MYFPIVAQELCVAESKGSCNLGIGYAWGCP